MRHRRIVRDASLLTGEHCNPGRERYPGWFTTAFFHHPAELAAEITESGLVLEALLGIEGPGGFIDAGWGDPEQRPAIVRAARAAAAEPTLLGLNPHLLAVARREA